MSDRFLRLPDIIGDPERGIKPLIPVGRSSWFAGIRKGRYPKGLKIAPRTTVWRESEILALIEGLANDQAA